MTSEFVGLLQQRLDFASPPFRIARFQQAHHARLRKNRQWIRRAFSHGRFSRHERSIERSQLPGIGGVAAPVVEPAGNDETPPTF